MAVVLVVRDVDNRDGGGNGLVKGGSDTRGGGQEGSL